MTRLGGAPRGLRPRGHAHHATRHRTHHRGRAMDSAERCFEEGRQRPLTTNSGKRREGTGGDERRGHAPLRCGKQWTSPSESTSPAAVPIAPATEKGELRRLDVRTPYSITPTGRTLRAPIHCQLNAKAALGGPKRREHRRSQSGILLPIVPERSGDNADCNALSAALPILPRRRLREWQSKASREGAHV